MKEEIYMVRLIAGKKGSGKSKQMIKLANEQLKKKSGNVVFLDDDDRNIFDLNHDVRFIDLSEYKVDKCEGFLGFINGMISQDYDIDTVFIDGVLNIIDIEFSQVEDLIKEIDSIGNKHNIDFYIAISHPITELPNSLERYLY